MLDAKNVQRERLRAHGDEAVLADDAVLLAATDEFSSEKKQRSLAAIDEDELIDACAAGRVGDNAAIAAARHAIATLFGDKDFAGPAGPLVDALPDARLVTLEGCDHFATPKDFRFIDEALRFIDAG